MADELELIRGVVASPVDEVLLDSVDQSAGREASEQRRPQRIRRGGQSVPAQLVHIVPARMRHAEHHHAHRASLVVEQGARVAIEAHAQQAFHHSLRR